MIDYGGGVRIRFRYVGLTTAVAQWIDDAAGTVTRSVGTGWRGERLLDWTGSGSNLRIYGDEWPPRCDLAGQRHRPCQPVTPL